MFLATFAHFVARLIVLHLRFFGAQVAYSFRWTFARRMASYSACSAHSIWARAYFLAMPRLRAQRTVTRAIFVVGSMRVRSTVGANHRVGDPMIIRFRFLLDSLYAAALLGPPLPGPYLLTQRPCLDLRCQALTYLRSCDAQQSLTAMDVSDRSDLLFCFCDPNSRPNFKFWPN